jgi:hypothetical protein
MEDSNPMLIIGIPNRLRKFDRLMSNLRSNAKNLLTHYDLHVTLHDIAAFAGKIDNWKALDYRNFSHLPTVNHGESVLRQMRIARNCQQLHIPIEFCQCQQSRISINVADGMSELAAEFIIGQLNDRLSNVKHLCHQLELHEIHQVNVNMEQKMYDIRLSVSPSFGVFEAMIKVVNKSNIHLISDIIRTNLYGQQSHCVAENNELKPYCFCRSSSTGE